jgi:hypothetical protein
MGHDRRRPSPWGGGVQVEAVPEKGDADPDPGSQARDAPQGFKSPPERRRYALQGSPGKSDPTMAKTPRKKRIIGA